MAVDYLQPILPWSGPQEEDRWFRQILLPLLALFSVLSGVVPYLSLAPLESEADGGMAPRLVRIIPEPIELMASSSAARPLERGSPRADLPPPIEKPETPQPTVVAAPSPATPSPARPDSEAAVRKDVEKLGVLALRDQFAELEKLSPVGTALESAPANAPATVAGVQAAAPKGPSRLTTEVTAGSGGIGSGLVGSQAFLGVPGISDGFGDGNGDGAGRVGLGRGSIGAGRASGEAGAPSGRVLRKTRSQEEIQEILDKNKRAIYTIYNRELIRDATLRGKVVVSITIAPSGKVTQCRVVYSELKSASFEAKLIRLLQGIHFGEKPDVPPVTTRVPIEFFPV